MSTLPATREDITTVRAVSGPPSTWDYFLDRAFRVLARFYDQQIASKIQRAFGVDEAFSDAALAAPVIVDRATAPARAPAPP